MARAARSSAVEPADREGLEGFGNWIAGFERC
jgi:hypothetical protein